MDPLTEELESLTALLPRLMGAFQRLFARDLARFGLTFPQFVTLHVLEQAEGQCRMGPLASQAMQSAASMTGIVDRLLEQGLVERERLPEDRRAVVVRWTEEGRDLLARVKVSRQEQGRQLLSSLTPEERQCIHKALLLMVERMERGERGEED